MKHFLILFLLPIICHAQQVTISGYVSDSRTGENLIGANVYVPSAGKGTATNAYGFYSLSLPRGNYELKCSFIGFEEAILTFPLRRDTTIDFKLSPSSQVIDEVVVTDVIEDKNVSSTEVSTIELEVSQVKELPAIFGEVDILKAIQLLPGVQSAGEGSAGFYVRGGGPDQNLILLDEAVVYNASHLLGFFSVFNADAIKNVELIKGGMPAKYGGRLSSVLDISMRDGNNQNHGISGGIGLISSRATAEGPLLKDKSSYIISARRTYIDVLLRPILNRNPDLAGNSYYFYDLNAKMNYRISPKDRIFLSGYFGRDRFSFKSPDSDFQVAVPWGNATASLRWNHLINPRLFVNTTAVFSDYQFEFNAFQDDFSIGLFSGITDYNLKSDFSYIPNTQHKIDFGINYTWHVFIPSNVTANLGGTEINVGEVIKYRAHEFAAYFQDEWEINSVFKINAGLRYSGFAQVGPFDRFNYNEQNELLGITSYDKGEVIKYYGGLEPRLTARYQINETTSLKTGLTKNFQYVHLASISSLALPTDVWVPSSDVVKPQIGYQAAFGIFRNLKENTFEASIEVYYKSLNNLIEYKEYETPGPSSEDNPDNAFTFGTGQSYGAEFFFKKRLGKATGWVGYTISKTTRTFDELNNGETFVAKYDRVHDLSATLTWKFAKSWTMGSVFVYATGTAITLPENRYFIDGEVVVEYGLRNSYRIAPYHRLDLSATYKKKKEKRFQSSWTFAVYNVYNRQNPYFIYFDTDGDLSEGNLTTSAQQVSLFPVLPSITWNFEF